MVLNDATLKNEDIYLKDYADGAECYAGLAAYWRFYDEERPHQSLAYRTPAEVYYGANPWRLGRQRHAAPPRGKRVTSKNRLKDRVFETEG